MYYCIIQPPDPFGQRRVAFGAGLEMSEDSGEAGGIAAETDRHRASWTKLVALPLASPVPVRGIKERWTRC